MADALQTMLRGVLVVCLLATLPVYIWGLYFSGAVADPLMRDYGIPISVLIVTLTVICCAATFALLWRWRRHRLGRTAGNEISSLELIGASVLTLPFMLVLIDFISDGRLIDAGCRTGLVSDYFWIAVDDLAKGVLLDFMESFGFDLFHCDAKPRALTAAATSFAIRSFTTYIVVYLAVTKYRRWRQKWPPVNVSAV